MQFLAMLMPLLGLVSFAAYIWLVVVAFKHSTGWGVLVLLFSPVTAIIFAVKFWPESKKPFLVYAGASGAWCAIFMTFVVFLGGSMFQMAQEMSDAAVTQDRAAQLMGRDMDRMENSGLMDDADKEDRQEVRTAREEMQPQPEPATLTVAMNTVEDFEPQPTAQIAAETRTTETRPATPAKSPVARDAVPLREIGKFMGQKLEIVMTDGSEFVGRLVAENGDKLEFERRLMAGTFTIFTTRDQIRSVRKIKTR